MTDAHLTQTPAESVAQWLNNIYDELGGGEPHVSALDKSIPEMLALVWNALDPDANASNLTHTTLQMLAGIWNVFDPEANASPKTHSFPELLAGVVNEAVEGASVDPKTTSVAEMFGLIGGGGALGPLTDPLELDPFAWYDPSDLSTLFQDTGGTVPVTADGDPVRLIRDKSGNNRHLTPFGGGGDANRPIYHTDGTYHWIEGDGVNDYLGASTGFALNQPFDVVSGIYQVTRTASDSIIGGARLYQATSSPTLRMRAPSSGVEIGLDFALETAGVISTRFNGASSAIQLNNEAPVEGDAGSGNVTVFSLLSSNQSSNWANARLYQCLIYSRLSDANLARVQVYAAGKTGVFF